jgi:Bacterial virulence factor lipase N-terminal
MLLPGRERRRLSRSCSFAIILTLFTPVLLLARDVHPLFDLNSTTASPFPSDRFTVFDFQQRTNLRVNLPLPNCATHPSDCLDVALLNQLDGFNTQPRISIPFDGAIDPASVNSKTVFLVRIGDLAGSEDFRPQIIGINQIVWDPTSLTLFVESDQHLDQHTSYLLIVTKGVHDAAGDPIETDKEFRELRRPDDPKDLQTRIYRKVLGFLLHQDVLEQIAGVSRRDVVVASLFTTGTVTSTLEKISAQIKQASAPAVSFNLGLHGERTVFALPAVQGILFGQQVSASGALRTVPVPTPALQIFPGAISTLAFGRFTALNFETAGGFIPAVPTRSGLPAVQHTEDIYFNLILPAGPRPPSGWPVAIFGHGFGDNKNNSPLAVASTLAARGIATLAINAVGHGFGPAGILTVLQATGPVVLPAGGRAVDQNGDGTFDATEGLFATGPHFDIAARDGLQQTVADLMQVVHAVQGGIDVNGDGSAALDPHRIYYLGQSLGGIYGTILLGAEADVHTGGVNAAGGTLTDISRLSPDFRPLLTLFLVSRVPPLLNLPGFNFDDNFPLRDQAPVVNTVPGAIAIQDFEDKTRWLGQAGDPVSWAPSIRKSPLAGANPKNVIVQFARGDKTVPNPTTTALIRAGDLRDRTTLFRNDLAFALGVGFTKNPHAFLTNIGGSPAAALAALQAQAQIGVFFASDGVLTIDPDGPGLLFETPTSLLPEDLAFIP